MFINNELTPRHVYSYVMKDKNLNGDVKLTRFSRFSSLYPPSAHIAYPSRYRRFPILTIPFGISTEMFAQSVFYSVVCFHCTIIP